MSAIACFLGRLCNRRYHSQKPKQNHHFRPKETGDIEFGFDKRIPSGKQAGNGGSRGHKQSENGRDHFKGEMRPADHEGEPRAGA